MNSYQQWQVRKSLFKRTLSNDIAYGLLIVGGYTVSIIVMSVLASAH